MLNRADLFAVTRRVWPLTPPILLGAAACLLVAGPLPLFPSNIAWLGKYDDVQHYVGWIFFRHAPWGFPIGINPEFGLEVSSSIFYSDSIPLLAFVFKGVGHWLPEPFQYFGFWYLMCFVLQACLAWLLVGMLTPHWEVRTLGAGLFVFAPPMLRRLGGPFGAHHSLVGQWLILAALWLCLNPRTPYRGGLWMALAVGSAWVHPYLLAMVVALWLSDWASRVLAMRHESRQRSAALAQFAEALLIPAATVAALWQAGYFLVQSGLSEKGFGVYRMNILAPISASGWSHFLPELPPAQGEYGATNYYGLGALLLFALALPPVVQGGVAALRTTDRPLLARRWWPLALACVALTAYALSNRLGFGPWDVTIPLPDAISQLAGRLRASARFFWPVYYLLLWLALRSFIDGYGLSSRRGRIVGAAALTVLLALQIWDTAPGWWPMREEHAVEGSAYASPMQSEFWRSAATYYKRVRIVPTANYDLRWLPVARYAASNGLGTDAVYLARLDKDKLALLNEKIQRQLETGRFDDDTLYVLDVRAVEVVKKTMNPADDLLAVVDRFEVLAPRWKQCGPCRTTGGYTVVR